MNLYFRYFRIPVNRDKVITVITENTTPRYNYRKYRITSNTVDNGNKEILDIGIKIWNTTTPNI